MDEAVRAFWYTYAKVNELEAIPLPNAWMFGDGTKEMGDILSKLVIEGKKTGTYSAYLLYDLDEEPLPQLGQYDIILNGSNEPVAIIKNTKVEVKKMNEVDERFARSEGEGDLSYAYWYAAHERFFKLQFAEHNREFSDENLIVCENFEVVYLNSEME